MHGDSTDWKVPSVLSTGSTQLSAAQIAEGLSGPVSGAVEQGQALENS